VGETEFRLVRSTRDPFVTAALCVLSLFRQRSGYNATTWNVQDFY